MTERATRFQEVECQLHGTVIGVLCCRHIAKRIFERGELGERGFLHVTKGLKIVACDVCLAEFADVHAGIELTPQREDQALGVILPACSKCFEELGGVE